MPSGKFVPTHGGMDSAISSGDVSLLTGDGSSGDGSSGD